MEQLCIVSNGTHEKIAEKGDCYQSKQIGKYLTVKKQEVQDFLELLGGESRRTPNKQKNEVQVPANSNYL